MSSEWRESTWGEISKLEYGKAIRGYQEAKGKYPVYGTNGQIGWHDKSLSVQPGVIIGRKGAYRGIHYSDKPFFVIDTAFYLVPKNQINVKWAYYCLLTYDINRMDSGSAIPSTSRDEFYKLSVKIPSLAEQSSIANFLSALDDRIALLRETNATLESIAQAIFKSWFIDFDPVKAKQQGEEPQGMDAATAALFPDAFQDSELGLIPAGWRVGCVENVLELAYGKALKATDRITGDIPVYGSGGIIGYHNEPLVDTPSVIVGRKGTVGSLYCEDMPFFPIDTVYYVKGKISLTYCYYLLKTLGLDGMNTDAAVPGLNRNNVYRLSVIIPSQSLIGKFDSLVDTLRRKIRINKEKAQVLASIRDALLPRLISGKLRLPEAEAMVGVAGL